jgi:hypothetical protein
MDSIVEPSTRPQPELHEHALERVARNLLLKSQPLTDNGEIQASRCTVCHHLLSPALHDPPVAPEEDHRDRDGDEPDCEWQGRPEEQREHRSGEGGDRDSDDRVSIDPGPILDGSESKLDNLAQATPQRRGNTVALTLQERRRLPNRSRLAHGRDTTLWANLGALPTSVAFATRRRRSSSSLCSGSSTVRKHRSGQMLKQKSR